MDSTELWAAPLLLLPGVGLLILSTSIRFGKLHEELQLRRGQGQLTAVAHLCRRARFFHIALVSLYISVALLALSSLLGSLANRWFTSLTWIPEAIMLLGFAVIAFAAIQLILESRMLMTAILDDADQAPPKS